MKTRKYVVTVRIESFFNMIVEAENPIVAVAKAKTFPLNEEYKTQIIENITDDRFCDADDVTLCKGYEEVPV